ncbi:class I SAM-dependent methyltransferase [Taklimakanibacter deserti]|uniref:class I SAM-dependent methyltransferase n=1 Tax=Taklimakanibacter deserti TaxID=2267839 RepID=UPI000E652FA8
MPEGLQGQVTGSAAEIYETFFVPALFQQWTCVVADAARIAPGQSVLDVACGTGILARAVAERVAPYGSVVGLDRNEGMLAIARCKAPNVDWKSGRAEKLPFPDATFDAVISQFGLMFFDDRRVAVREMWRVLAPGGRLSIAVWDALENNPGYAAMASLLERLFGARIASELHAPFALGNRETLHSLFAGSGIPNVGVSTHPGEARFPSIEDWVRTDVKGWTLADLIDDEQYRLLLHEAGTALRPYVQANGEVAFEAPAHIVTAEKAA